MFPLNVTRIIPRHITRAVQNDEELNNLFNGITIVAGGVISNIPNALVPKAVKEMDCRPLHES